MSQPSTTFKRRIARALQVLPFGAHLLRLSVGMLQPRFTTGVVGVLPDTSGERVLLVEHVFHPRTPWGLPGGWIGRGEDPADTIVREFREETGLRIRAIRPLLIQRSPIRFPRHMDIAYLCALQDGDLAITLNSELLAYEWVPIDDLPQLVAFHTDSIQAARDSWINNRGDHG